MPKVASSSSSPTFLFFIISLPSNLHGHSTLVARAPLPFPRDPRPPSVGRRAEGPGGRTERRRHRQWGSIFFRFARALAVAMAMAAAMAGSRSRPHLPACLPLSRAAARTQKIPSMAFHISVGPNSKGALLVPLTRCLAASSSFSQSRGATDQT